MRSGILSIKNLHISVDQKPIVHGVSLVIKPGETHVLMGPNGSGKSTLAATLMGHPQYAIQKGAVRFAGKNLLQLDPHERARLGFFLAFQYPMEIPGVPLNHFLRTAYNATHSKKLSVLDFRRMLVQCMKDLRIEPKFAERYLNEGFSGGEKKKAEMLQMLVLAPKMVVCDETDSGLDVDALKIVAKGIKRVVRGGAGALIITHYQRLLQHITPEVVHVMVDGKIVEKGGPALARRIEKNGYDHYTSFAAGDIAHA